jgi:hypothetical protein
MPESRERQSMHCSMACFPLGSFVGSSWYTTLNFAHHAARPVAFAAVRLLCISSGGRSVCLKNYCKLLREGAAPGKSRCEAAAGCEVPAGCWAAITANYLYSLRSRYCGLSIGSLSPQEQRKQLERTRWAYACEPWCTLIAAFDPFCWKRATCWTVKGLWCMFRLGSLQCTANRWHRSATHTLYIKVKPLYINSLYIIHL